jgi:DNA (cytosine-5)-methyltransferase 1
MIKEISYTCLFLDTVKEFKPKAFVIENVTGMATLYGGGIKDKIIASFTEVGYNVKTQIVCAADYGIPQIRKRLIFVGVRMIMANLFSEPSHDPKNYVTCEEAIGDLPPRISDLGCEIDKYL